ncbi:MAG TPA: hypothetical protein VNK41_04250 [Vicinamibacterales bacterium]|nr:hypothetical protein [Vicinamibacterales bacterium]
MESRTRRQVVLLTVLLVILAGVLWWNFAPAPVPEQQPPARQARQTARRAQGPAPVEKIRLEALSTARVQPTRDGRNPFRFRAPGPRVLEEEAGDGPDSGVQQSAAAGAPITPSGPPPIPLRFIGVMRLPGSGRLIAVLSDGQGVYRGSEGDIIEGRYRIVRLAPESVELAYIDGRGHQVIRLAGS